MGLPFGSRVWVKFQINLIETRCQNSATTPDELAVLAVAGKCHSSQTPVEVSYMQGITQTRTLKLSLRGSPQVLNFPKCHRGTEDYSSPIGSK